MEPTERLARLVQAQYGGGKCGSVVLAVSADDGRFAWSGGAGPSSDQDPRPLHGAAPFFIASATKLYTTTIVLQLVDEGTVRLSDRATDLLQDIGLGGIHLLGGVDRSSELTVLHLLSHTSGLADYFEGKQTDGTTIMGELVAGNDRGWTLANVLELHRTKLRPHFVPGAPSKALYSDTNFQLLGAIIEQVTGKPYSYVVAERIARPLGLTATYVFTRDDLARYDSIAAMRHGARPLRIPLAMASFGPDGGIVSTADEGIVFLRAFMQGRLFQSRHLPQMQMWNRIFFPLQYGVGIMKFQLPRFFSPFKALPAFIGHSGASGTVMYHCPDRGIYVSGTVNQTRQRDLPYRLMMRAVNGLD